MIMVIKMEMLTGITIDNDRIEQTRDFKYFVVTLDMQNNMQGEINIRLTTANKCYFTIT